MTMKLLKSPKLLKSTRLKRLLAASLLTVFVISPYQAQLRAQGQIQTAEKAKQTSIPASLSYDISKLPEPVQKMRIAIIKAARSGDLEHVRQVMETNEIPPVVSTATREDPIEYWKKISADGTGQDLLALLSEIMEGGYAVANPGKADESYIWPYLAEISLKELTPRQQVELYRLLPFKEAQIMKKTGKYTFYRASIGKDGTWHSFILGK